MLRVSFSMTILAEGGRAGDCERVGEREREREREVERIVVSGSRETSVGVRERPRDMLRRGGEDDMVVTVVEV